MDKKIKEDKQFIQKITEIQKGRWSHIKPIKIYADESVNVAIVEGLKRRGVNAFSAKDLGKLGLTDEEQLKTAIQKQAVIFTHDVDFIKIAIKRNHLGIIYVHQQKLTIGECIKKLKFIAETKTAEEMQNQILFL
jgi:predicted nuclease of predicted toxin-antitoxin system